jgi:alpha/beta hydrolase family protein
MDTNVAFEGKKYRVNGIDMHVVIQGQGPDVLLVHGFPDSIAVWRHQIAALVAAGYRVIAPHQRGFGLSEAPRETRAYAIENYVADLAALLDTLGIDVERGLSRVGYARRRDQRVVQPASGNDLDPILRKYRIGGDHRHVVHLGCGNNHPVARIGVHSRQFRRTDADLEIQR